MSFFFPNPPPVFPTLQPGYSSHMKPTFASRIATSVNGFETRTAAQVYPLVEFELTFEYLPDQTQNPVPDAYFSGKRDFEQICGLFGLVRGQYGRFLYACPEDNSRIGGAIGTGDGSTTTFPVIRYWGTISALPVTLNQSLPFKIYLNASDDTSNWTANADGTTITRSSAPALGDAVTMDFSFYYLCRFLEDIEDFDQFYHHLWQLKTLKFRSVKQ